MGFPRSLLSVGLACTRCWVAGVLLSLVIGCAYENAPEQPNLPNSNDQVVAQTIFGAKDTRSAIYEVDRTQTGATYADILLDGRRRFAMFDAAGTLSWTTGIPGSVTEVFVFPSSGDPTGEAAVTVAGVDTDGNQSYDVADIRVLSSAGTELDHVRIPRDQYQYYFQTIELLAQDAVGAEFLVGGGAREGDVRYPFFARVSITNDGTITVDEQKILTDQPRWIVKRLTWNGNAAAPEYYATALRIFRNGDLGDDAVWGLTDSLAVAWKRVVLPEETYWVSLGQVAYYAGNVYAVGRSLVEKDDDYFQVATVASVSETGVLNWVQNLELSRFTDSYYDAEIVNGELWAVGTVSELTHEPTNRKFGYGLLSRFELPSGRALLHASFGGKDYDSMFWAIDVDGASVFCGGFTKHYIANYWEQGWLAEIDVSGSRASLAAVPAVPMAEVRAEDALRRDVGRSGRTGDRSQ